MFAMFAASCRWVVLGLLAFSSGCAMCSSCDDYTYPAYGGRWERLDPCYGRVGSIFTPEVGQRVDGDEYYSPDKEAVPHQSESQKPTEATPSESTPDSNPSEGSLIEGTPQETMPSETAPNKTVPGDDTPSETEPSDGQMPAEDAAPSPQSLTPPQARSKQGRPLDASVLRQPVRPRR